MGSRERLEMCYVRSGFGDVNIEVEYRALMRPPNQLSASHPVNTNNIKGDEEEETDVQRRRRERAIELDAKAGDLTCLFVAFGFALQ